MVNDDDVNCSGIVVSISISVKVKIVYNVYLIVCKNKKQYFQEE